MQLPLAALFVATTSVLAQIITADDVLRKPYASLLASPLDIRQQDSSSSSSKDAEALLKPDGTLNMTSFSALTSATCESVLTRLRRAESPSGMSICFNLPSLNANNGIFEADLRLYKVSEPRGTWAGVDPASINVTVGFANAKVKNVTEKQVMGIGMVGDIQVRQVDGGSSVREMQRYLLVGQVQRDKLHANMSMSTLEALLMPSLALVAKDPSSPDKSMTEVISPNEASFVTGVFSTLTPQSSFARAQAAVASSVALLDKGELPFVMPGTQILIFPVGLIVTGTWALLGISVYAFGTVERWRFRESYRERVKGAGGGRL